MSASKQPCWDRTESTYHAHSALRRGREIVGDPSHQWWESTIHATGDTEQKAVGDSRILWVRDRKLSDEAAHRDTIRDDYEDPADLVFVAKPCEQEHKHNGENVDRNREQLSFC